MIIWCIAIAFLTIIVWDYLLRDHRKVKLAKQFNGPLAIPLLGNFYMYLNKKPEGELISCSLILSITISQMTYQSVYGAIKIKQKTEAY